MVERPRMEFGYHPPSGERRLEVIRPREFVSDLHHSLDIATQSFGSIWVSDHMNYEDEFRLECWTQLAWIAARYPGVKLGTVVMSNSFRSPSLMAKMGASLQSLTEGRFILGYGAGWHEGEHNAFGFGYPSPRVRVEMLEEGVQVIKALWTESPANFSGVHYRIANASCEPRPDPVPPIMIGGAGERRTLRVVARYADWWNDLLRPPAEQRRKLEVLRQHCHAEGRDYDSIRKRGSQGVYRPVSRQGCRGRRRLASERSAAHSRRPVVGAGAADGAGRAGVRPVHTPVPALPGDG